MGFNQLRMTFPTDGPAGTRPDATLVAVLVVLGVGSLFLVPTLLWLLTLTQRGVLADDH